jgi:hypothetical protein
MWCPSGSQAQRLVEMNWVGVQTEEEEGFLDETLQCHCDLQCRTCCACSRHQYGLRELQIHYDAEPSVTVEWAFQGLLVQQWLLQTKGLQARYC